MNKKPTYEELEQKVRELESAQPAECMAMLKELQQKEKLYKNLYDNMLNEVHIWQLVYDDSGNIKTWKLVDANPAALKSWNKNLPDVIGRTADEIFPNSNTSELFMPVVKKIFTEGTPHTWEQHFPDTNQILHMISVPIGEYFFSTGYDITDYKQTQESLLEANLKQKEAIEAGNVGFWDWNLETNKVGYSKEWKSQIGYEDHEISDDFEEWRSRVHPDDLSRTLELVDKSINEANTNHKIEFRFRHKDGSYRWILVQASILQDENGKPLRMLGSHIDISDQKKAEREYLMLKTAIDQAPVGIALADKDINIYYCNPEGLGMRGGKVGDLVEIPKDAFKNWQIYMTSGEPYEIENLPLVRSISNGEVIREEFLVKHQDGTDHFCDAVACPVIENEKIVGGMVIFLDVSEQKKAENSLAQSEARLRNIIDSSPFPIAVTDPNDETFIYWSHSALEMFGHHPEKVSDWYQLAYPDSVYREQVIKRWKPYLEKARKSNKAINTGEYQIACKDGSSKICEIYAQFFPDNLIITLHDITERKRIEEVMRKSNKMLKLTEAMANIGSWEWDVRDDRTHWSEELFRIFGRHPAEDAPPFSEQSGLYVNEDMQRLREAVAICVERGTPYEIEVRAIRTDGEIRHCVSRGQAQYDENGKVRRLVGSFQDITNIRHAEKRIKFIERRNQALLDHSPVCHKIVDLNFNLQYMSASGFKMLRLDHNDEVYGKPYPFYFFPESFKKEMTEGLKQVKKTGEIVINEGFTNDIEGNEIWLYSSLIPVFDDEGKIDYLTVVSSDITQRKQADEAIREYSERLEEMVEDRTQELKKVQEELLLKERLAVLGHFSGSISHELRNPLAVIDSSIYLLKMKLDRSDKKISKVLERIASNVKKSTDIIQSLLNLSRMEKPKTEKIDLASLLAETIRSVNIPDTVEVVLELADKAIFIHIEIEQMRMALKNIIQNSIQAMNETGKLTILSLTPEMGYIVLKIMDTGPGILHEHLEKVFEPLFSTKTHGIGFGLSISKMIIENHGGTVQAESNLGKGASFVISFPIEMTAGQTIG